MSTTNAAMVQHGDTTSQRTKKEDQKYQEFLPWESRHISPYIPKLEQTDYKNDFSLQEVKNRNVIDSFDPFMQNYIIPISRQTQGYSEYLNDLEEDQQARFTMDQFRQFVMKNSTPELSSEAALLNMKYRQRLVNVLDTYSKGQSLAQNNQTIQIPNNQDKPVLTNSKILSNIAPGSIAPIYSSGKIEFKQTDNQRRNISSSQSLPIQEVGADGMKNSNVSKSILQKVVGKFQESIDPSHSGYKSKPPQSFDTPEQLLSSYKKSLKTDLCYDYEKILQGEGKILVGDDGVSWNNTSFDYVQKLREWAGDNDSFITAALAQYKDIETPIYLTPRIFRQVRPIDKIRREIIRTVDGTHVPYETVVERRSIEIMHQRDFLVQPRFVEIGQGQVEKISDVFSFDRSFIVEQNPLTKSEIFHEYPIHLTQTELFDFLFQTGIEVKQLEYFTPNLFNESVLKKENPPAKSIPPKNKPVKISPHVPSTNQKPPLTIPKEDQVRVPNNKRDYGDEIRKFHYESSDWLDIQKELEKKERIRQYFQQGYELPQKLGLNKIVSFDRENNHGYQDDDY